MCKGKWKNNLLNMWVLFNFIRGKVLTLFCKYTPCNIKADQSQIIQKVLEQDSQRPRGYMDKIG